MRKKERALPMFVAILWPINFNRSLTYTQIMRERKKKKAMECKKMNHWQKGRPPARGRVCRGGALSCVWGTSRECFMSN